MIMDSNEKIKKNLAILFSLYPLSGLGISVISVLIVIAKGRGWSMPLVMLTFIPFLGNTVICLIAYLMLKNTVSFELILIKGKIKYLTVFLFIALTILQIVFYLLDTGVETQNISLEEIITLEENEDVYYVIFGAGNCLYCRDMQDIYEQAFNQRGNKKSLLLRYIV